MALRATSISRTPKSMFEVRIGRSRISSIPTVTLLTGDLTSAQFIDSSVKRCSNPRTWENHWIASSRSLTWRFPLVAGRILQANDRNPGDGVERGGPVQHPARSGGWRNLGSRVRVEYASPRFGAFTASARWQFGSGFPFTRPVGFDETFDFARELSNVRTTRGAARILLDKPFTARLPVVHRLDMSLTREFDVSFGQIVVQAGVINAYDRQNMFYYDLFTGRRLDQLPLAPYASLTLRYR